MTIPDPVNAFLEEPFPPLRHRVHISIDLPCDRHVLYPVAGGKHNPGTLHITLRRSTFANDCFQALTVLHAQNDPIRAVPGHHASNGDTSAQHVAPYRYRQITPM